MGILSSIGQLLTLALEIYSWLIVGRVLISWVNPDPYNPIVQFLVRATDPLLLPIQRRMPALGGFDLSPIVALLAIVVMQRVVAVLFSPMAGGGFSVLMVEMLALVHLLLTLYLLILLIRAVINIRSWWGFRRGTGAYINLHNPG
ncbi:MAG: YggT family protein, partial [Magnetococcales bacterium]|nr:YggT family protein [Magnetococcales bacterium]